MTELAIKLKERLGMDLDTALKELGLSQAAFERVVKVSVVSTAETLQVLDAAIVSGDRVAIAGAAHELKGVFMNLRLGALAAPAREMDLLSKAVAPLEAFRRPLEELRAQYMVLKDIL
jgi:HPt (histidine-containing phosphotransfer) domain-containing protein